MEKETLCELLVKGAVPFAAGATFGLADIALFQLPILSAGILAKDTALTFDSLHHNMAYEGIRPVDVIPQTLAYCLGAAMPFVIKYHDQLINLLYWYN